MVNVEVTPLALHYLEYGDRDAPLMLFLHGGGVSGWMWDKQVQHFTHYHCIVPDLPEHGLKQDGTLFFIKNSAEQLIIEADGNQCRREESHRHRIFIRLAGPCSNAGNETGCHRLCRDQQRFSTTRSIREKIHQTAIGWTFPLLKNRRFSKLQAKTLYLNDEYFETYYEASRQSQPGTLVRVLEENMSFEIPEAFRYAKAKILVTVGEKETTVMKKSAKDIVALNTNRIGVILPKIGHGASLAMPDFFNQMIESWIRDGELPKGCKLINGRM